ncbi:MAG TPA: AI-2E family transporter [Anaerolineae bacterium]
MEDIWVSADPGRRNRLFLGLTVILLVASLIWAARGALLPYALALLLGYLLLPTVNWLDRQLQRVIRRGRLPRVLSILIVYLAGLALFAAFISMLVPVLVQQINALWAMRDNMVNTVGDLFQRTLDWYRTTAPANVQAQVDDNLRRAGTAIADALQTGVVRTFTIVSNIVSFILGFVVVPFWLFYVMYDEARLARSLREMIPSRYREDVSNIWLLIDTVLGAYVRGQALLCVTIGLMAFIGLSLLHVPYPHVLALIAGMFEFLPFIGPVLGLVPAVLVALIQSPMLALWTLLLYLGIQQIENVVLAPRISGNAVELHPAAIMVVLVIGNEVAGLGGMLVAVPLTAIARDVFHYLNARWQDEPCTPAEALARMGRQRQS